ncbi:hydrogenase iron-sulfur subunit [Oryzomonas japonica]|uniref:Hydrogenase iron-sulfur subunit n=1 Tax=Oryzomonas japonica TaxID=2603858 RepID=A0A7J4ZQH5_9BACT|nr:hydrogenase iron-sulfur subunit [Oryzomonas japonica]KAB0665318.1 hydrogenase iron-sulfur subunit [Oryzomonas japonica]
MSCQTMPNVAPHPATKEVEAGVPGEVRIVAFLCNWCSYAGADKTGMNQLPVPAELSVVRVMCSGRVEPTLILETFQKGADGVMVLACHPGDCHYKEGNLRAFCRAELLERMMPQLGVDPARFYFDYVSAAEAEKFSQVTNDFVASIRALGDTAPGR